ncbi:hypothetical protein TIFTF001_034426 [Ficus carica]|uniref:Uncharacterized protein n=1 Tax=Ficus carica TaxID=3494 RepID=A0AA88DZW4_FICCA|nr:hypothetical protein TIFTF001_034426 [Ficus carica]
MGFSAARLGVRRCLREAETRETEREREAEEILRVVVERVLHHVLLFERLMCIFRTTMEAIRLRNRYSTMRWRDYGHLVEIFVFNCVFSYLDPAFKFPAHSVNVQFQFRKAFWQKQKIFVGQYSNQMQPRQEHDIGKAIPASETHLCATPSQGIEGGLRTRAERAGVSKNTALWPLQQLKYHGWSISSLNY